MKKFLSIYLAVVILTAGVLSSCGNKTFECDGCGATVKGKPHEITILEENMNMCDKCYKDIEDIRKEFEEFN